MSETFKKVIELHQQGKTYREIASILGVSNGTVSFHINKHKRPVVIPNTNYSTLLRPELRNQIIQLKTKGHTHKEIAKQLHCSLSIITYHTNPESRLKAIKNSTKCHKQRHPYKRKIWDFGKGKSTFTVQDVIDKFGEKPKCYITGVEIDIYKTRSYHFDHVIPKSCNGNNSFDNLGICTKEANLAKSGKNYEDFIKLCQLAIQNYLKGVNQD